MRREADLVGEEEGRSIDKLYCFIKASLLSLQSTGGFGESDFVCPLCGGKAHIVRRKGDIYNNGKIECECGYGFEF